MAEKSLAFVAACWVCWVALAWAPYASLFFYWRHLVDTVPDAAHGEISGPILYVLPILWWLGIAASVVITVFALVLALMVRRTRPD